jgi:hypothetical protein
MGRFHLETFRDNPPEVLRTAKLAIELVRRHGMEFFAA